MLIISKLLSKANSQSSKITREFITMKTTFLLFIISAAFALNASDTLTESSEKNLIETETINATIECELCPSRESPGITKWLQLQTTKSNQASEISKVCFGFLFIVFL